MTTTPINNKNNDKRKEQDIPSPPRPSSELAQLRQEYSSTTLDETTMSDNPMHVFQEWLQEAIDHAQVHEPNAMCLATCDPVTLQPSARYMLLKGVEVMSDNENSNNNGNELPSNEPRHKDAFLWYTNYESRKGKELEANPHAALTFWWPELDERSVRIEGTVTRMTAEESDAYFQQRPPLARLGALASQQSQTIRGGTAAMQEKFDTVQQEYHAKMDHDGAPVIPRPDHWGGYRLNPTCIEFWKGRSSRLHDRIRYTKRALQAPSINNDDSAINKLPEIGPRREGSGWIKERLQP